MTNNFLNELNGDVNRAIIANIAKRFKSVLIDERGFTIASNYIKSFIPYSKVKYATFNNDKATICLSNGVELEVCK